MTPDRDLQQLLDAWFTDGPTHVSNRVFDEAVGRLDRQRQRPAWRFLRREPHVTTTLKVVLAAAAVIVVGVSGLIVLGRPAGQVGGPPADSPTSTPIPSPSPSPTASPTAVAIRCDGDASVECAGPLAPGRHATANFSPAFTFDVPEGWENTQDRARTYRLMPRGGTFTFDLLSQVAIPEQNSACSAERKAGAGNSVTDWVTFLTEHPGLSASTPERVTVGGREGTRVTFRVAVDWPQTCPRSVLNAVVTMTDSGSPPSRVLYVDDQVSSFTILDVDGETVILRVESGPATGAHERDLGTAQPIIDSIQFAPPG